MSRQITPPVPVSRVIDLLGADVRRVSGPVDRMVTCVAPLESTRTGALTFCRASDGMEAAADLHIAAVIGPDTATLQARRGCATLILVENPRMSFIRAIRALVDEKPVAGIHPSAVVDPTAEVSPEAQIGPYAVIGPGCSVGLGTVLAPRVTLQRNVRIGRNTRIDTGTVIGGGGFGLEREADGSPLAFPQLGGVVIGDDVDIGANVCIDRGTLGDTAIADGCRIDNLSHIGHDVRMDRHAVVITNVTICGSVHLGERSWVAPNATVRNQLKVSKDAVVGLGAVVIRDVADGETVAGNPAVPIRKH